MNEIETHKIQNQSKSSTPSNSKSSYDLTTILNKRKMGILKPYIQDLRSEIKEVKTELKF